MTALLSRKKSLIRIENALSNRKSAAPEFSFRSGACSNAPLEVRHQYKPQRGPAEKRLPGGGYGLERPFRLFWRVRTGKRCGAAEACARPNPDARGEEGARACD